MRRALLLALWFPVAPATAQTWNSEPALALARRAVQRRAQAASDTALRDYKAQAHGFVFFLGQFGEGLTAPPRLVKADQLELEVYWKAPRFSKQRIIGWRDRAELPTDINYHLDHLGIVQNNFGTVIRLGDGDEVRDVLHPLSPRGPDLYAFALGDTVVLALPPPHRAVRVVGLLVRPRSLSRSSLVGTLYLDAETADLVRMSFSFTAASYVDRQIEDVSIVLDNALREGRFWLPYRQEIEIRRRATWMDIPARGIIRGRWEIDGYVLNVGLADAWFRGGGPEITAAPREERDSFPWPTPLDAALRDLADPVRRSDLDRVRAEVTAVAGRRALTGLKARRLAARGVSDLVHVNRVEGLAVGGGVVWRFGGDRVEVRLLGSYGFADRRGKGAVSVTDAGGVHASVYREVRDVGDTPVIAPVLNSLASQEFGDDYGDYYRAEGARLGVQRGLSGGAEGRDGGRGEWSAVVGRERVSALAVTAVPAAGRFRPNPALGGERGGTGADPDVTYARVTLRRRGTGFAEFGELLGELALEAGRRDGGPGYVRLTGVAQLQVPVGPTRLQVRATGGAAGGGLPPHRAFVLGGRGTLLGDGFRSWGGARVGLVHAEWRVPVRLLSVGIGSYARVPAPLTLAPYVAAGGTGRPVPGTPWAATRHPRVTVGLGVEWLRVLRCEVGVGLQSRRARFAFDVSRDFWGIL
ncbi:MAG: hypothetical protein ACREL9_14540 [Gemmatimonadales bacterium]